MIRIGSRGNAVRRWQKHLRSDGFPNLVLDGIFGGATRAATIQWQRNHGLVPDGIVGPYTWAAADLGPAPTARPVPSAPGATRWPRDNVTALRAFYGAPGSNLVRLTPPYPLLYQGNNVPSIACHARIHDPVLRVLTRVLDYYGASGVEELNLNRWDGCYNPRPITGGTRLSTHAFAAAHDWWAAQNAYRWGRDRAALARPEYDAWWEAWEEEGFTSLGRARNFDWMHVQGADL